MHEVHTAKNILKMAKAEADLRGLSSIRSIRVRIGAWTGIDIDHLRHDFQTVAPTISLHVEPVEPSARCEDCGADFEPKPGSLNCDKCGSRKVTLNQEKDIELVGVE